MARAYMSIGKYAEAMALLDRTMEHIGSATATAAYDQVAMHT